MKHLFTSAIFLSSCFAPRALAQEATPESQHSAGVVAGVYLPVGAEGYNTGFGGLAFWEMKLSPQLAVGASGGYFRLAESEFFSVGISTLRATISYSIGDTILLPFVGAEAGFDYVSLSLGTLSVSSDPYLAFGGFGGIKYQINDQIDFVALAKVNMTLTDEDSLKAVVVGAGASYHF